MSEQIKILFISAPIGAGHTKAALAVSKELQNKYPNSNVVIANLFDFFPAWLGKTILNVYLKILTVFPQAYGWLYSWGNKNSSAVWGRELVYGLLAKAVKRYIDEYQPQVIVCTHATPAGICAHLIKNKILSIPVLGIVTDFVVHRLWVYSEITHYFVADKSLCHYLLNHGIPLEKSTDFGIPVEKKFTLARSIALSELGLQSGLPVILIMGGGTGLMPMEEMIDMLDKSNEGFQIVAITGFNRKLYNTLHIRRMGWKKRIQILGFVENVDEIMRSSTVIISKPGGLTSAEALCAGLPIMIYRPIPGQEEANTSYLVASGAATRCDSLKDLVNTLEEILQSQIRLQEFKRQAAVLAKPNAAENITDYIIKIVKNGKLS